MSDNTLTTSPNIEVYTPAAKLYEKWRAKYPKELLDAADLAQQGMKILELGCGPGTLTLDLLKRGCIVTAIEPGSGMMAEARKVCSGFDNNTINFYQASLKDVVDLEEESFDAIMAASAFHWAMKDDEDIVARCHKLLKPGGRLILLWNLPYEPKNQAISDQVAQLVGEETPFYFGMYSLDQHSRNISEKILKPIQETGLFAEFSRVEKLMEKDFEIDDYASFLKTLGNFIRMPNKELDNFLLKMEHVMKEHFKNESPALLQTIAKSIMNISTKL